MATISQVITGGRKSLSRDIDLTVSVNKPQAETTVDLNTLVFVTDTGTREHGSNRIAFYTSQNSVSSDWGSTSEAAKAARDFFAQSPRGRRFAVAQAFNSDQTGFMVTGAVVVSAFAAVTDGSLAISINGVSNDITGLDFTGNTTLADVAGTLQTGIRAIATGGFTSATVTVDGTSLRIASGTSGDSSTVSVLSAVSPSTGTDISGTGFLNGLTGTARTQAGYTFQSFTQELQFIAAAGLANGVYLYGWALDETYRDGANQTAAATWVAGENRVMGLTSNSALVLDAGTTTDIASVVMTAGNSRVFVEYHDDANYYPEVSMLSRFFGVDYSLANSVITGKFRDLPGIPTVDITDTELEVLRNKRCNVFTLTGVQSRVHREGVTGSATFYIDERINLDNYREELQTEVYNVFLRNNVVGQNPAGQALQAEAINRINARYVRNGMASARRVTDATRQEGFRIDPAFIVVPSPLQNLTTSQRSARQGAPFTIEVNLTGAQHSVAITVNAFD